MKFRFGTKRQRDLLSFNEIFSEITREYKLENYITVELLAQSWARIVGDIISIHSKPGRIYKDVLYIAVDHPVYGNELIMMKDTILQNVSREFGSNQILSIKTEVKHLVWRKDESKR